MILLWVRERQIASPLGDKKSMTGLDRAWALFWKLGRSKNVLGNMQKQIIPQGCGNCELIRSKSKLFMERSVVAIAQDLSQAKDLLNIQALMEEIKWKCLADIDLFMASLVELFETDSLEGVQQGLVILGYVQKVSQNYQGLAKETLLWSVRRLLGFLEGTNHSDEVRRLRSKALGMVCLSNLEEATYTAILKNSISDHQRIIWLTCLKELLSKTPRLQQNFLFLTFEMFEAIAHNSDRYSPKEVQTIYDCFEEFVHLARRNYQEFFDADIMGRFIELLSSLIRRLSEGDNDQGFEIFFEVVHSNNYLVYVRGLELLLNATSHKLSSSVTLLKAWINVVDTLDKGVVLSTQESSLIIKNILIVLFDEAVANVQKVELKEEGNEEICFQSAYLLVTITTTSDIDRNRVKLQQILDVKVATYRNSGYIILQSIYYSCVVSLNADRKQIKETFNKILQMYHQEISYIGVVTQERFNIHDTRIIRAVCFGMNCVISERKEQLNEFIPDLYDEAYNFVMKVITFKQDEFTQEMICELLAETLDEGKKHFSTRHPFRRLCHILKEFILPMTLQSNEVRVKGVLVEFSIEMLRYTSREEQLVLVRMFFLILNTDVYRKEYLEVICDMLKKILDFLRGFERDSPHEGELLQKLLEWLFFQLAKSQSCYLLKPLLSILEYNPNEAHKFLHIHSTLIKGFENKGCVEYLPIAMATFNQNEALEASQYLFSKVGTLLKYDPEDKDCTNLLKALSLLQKSVSCFDISLRTRPVIQALLNILCEIEDTKLLPQSKLKVANQILHTVGSILTTSVHVDMIKDIDIAPLQQIIDTKIERVYNKQANLSDKEVVYRLSMVQIAHYFIGLNTHLDLSNLMESCNTLLKSMSVDLLMRQQNQEAARQAFTTVTIAVKDIQRRLQT